MDHADTNSPAHAEPRSMVVVAGNIIQDERPPGPDGKPRFGTRLFRPGAKVYLATLHRSWSVLPKHADPPPDTPDVAVWRAKQAAIYAEDPVIIVGQHRKSRQWLECWVRSRLVTNWRLQLCFDPGALRALDRSWEGSAVRREDYRLPDSGRDDPREIRRFMAIAASCEAREAIRNSIGQVPIPFRGRCDVSIAGTGIDETRALAWLASKASAMTPDPHGMDNTYVATHVDREHVVRLDASQGAITISLEPLFSCWSSPEEFALELATALGGHVTFQKFDYATFGWLRCEVVSGKIVLASPT